MELPIELFLGGMGISIALAIFGFLRQPQIPAMLVFGGMFILIFAVATDTIIINSFSNSSSELIHYDVQSSTASAVIRTGGAEIRGEYLSTSSSQLLGDEIDCIETQLLKTGAPTGTATIGVFSGTSLVEASQLKKSFGTIDVSLLSTTQIQLHTFCLSGGETYTLVLDDLVGVMYRGGDVANNLNVRNDGSNPFDGTITFERRWDDVTQTWLSSTVTDRTSTYYLSASGVVITDNTYQFTELPKTLFALMGSIFMLCGALMVIRNN